MDNGPFIIFLRILSECQRAFSQSAPPNGSDALTDTMSEARSVTRFMRQMDTVSNVFKDGDYGNASKCTNYSNDLWNSSYLYHP